MKPDISTVSDLIELWPSAEVFADDIGLKWRSHARVMKFRGKLPQSHWDATVLAATRRGIPGINHGLLQKLHGRHHELQAAE